MLVPATTSSGSASCGPTPDRRRWRSLTSPQFWLNLQTHYDLDIARDRVAGQIEAITPLEVA